MRGLALTLALAAAACGGPGARELLLELPSSTRALLTLRPGEAPRAQTVSAAGAITPLVFALDGGPLELVAFGPPLEVLGLDPGPLELPLVAEAARLLPRPLSIQVTSEGAPLRELSLAEAQIGARGLPPRPRCLERRFADPVPLPGGGAPTAVLALRSGSALVLRARPGGWRVEPDGAVSSAPGLPAASDGFLAGGGALWVGSPDGAVRALPPDLDPSAPLPAPFARASSGILRIDGPPEGAVRAVVAVLATGEVVRLGPSEERRLGRVDLDANGDFTDVAWLDGGEALVAFDEVLDVLRLGDDAPVVERVPGTSLRNGVRRFVHAPDGGLYVGTRFGELTRRDRRGRWIKFEGAQSLAGVRDLTRFEGGASWVDDRGVVFTWSPSTGICPAVVPPDRDVEGHRLLALGLELLVVSLREGGGASAAWIRPRAP